MKSLRPDFNGNAKKSKVPPWYDLYEDWGLIESSIAMQYGIRLRAEPDMTWDEFCTLLAGIMPETPLGQIVQIRSENDREKLKNFSQEQHRIRNEWRSREVKQVQWTDEEKAKAVQEFQKIIQQAFG
ncbi:bacteriophage Gp15 family protein [Paenibacillus motobuensis]|uniref:Gp15 family bacteriophage protein n=1 Tax=Paenibacillus TaxID=44249 RepID=UPI0020415A76|nr:MULTISPECIES: Gp15 family bacteriophage protein [Paenibacillus]MCM3041717.1 bacteriophage Gp15 family protein [Paenibacillus lutimineralis]MCM3648821.1 bacteriophage Gp15 family protein [Paenibacillus motobuensis]